MPSPDEEASLLREGEEEEEESNEDDEGNEHITKRKGGEVHLFGALLVVCFVFAWAACGVSGLVFVFESHDAIKNERGKDLELHLLETAEVLLGVFVVVPLAGILPVWMAYVISISKIE